MSSSRNHLDSLYAILRGMIREEIDRTPGFRELTLESGYPANIQAEITILGAILLDNAAHAEARVLLDDDFSLDSHRRIFLRMSELIDLGKPVDIVTLTAKMGEQETKEIGGSAYLCSLTEGLPRLPRVSEYVTIVQEKAKLRRIMGSCEIAIKACQKQHESAADIVGQLGVNLKGIRGGKK